jgi:hypothetical protein
VAGFLELRRERHHLRDSALGEDDLAIYHVPKRALDGGTVIVKGREQ